MARIAKVQPIVYKALLERPETRADDYILVLEVYKHFISAEMSLKTVLEHHIELGLPSFASIVRSRRKLQKIYPELVNKEAAKIRAQERKEYKAYALNS
jgi:hypothetical protein